MIAIIGPFDGLHLVLFGVALLATWLCIFQRGGIIAMLDRMDEADDHGEDADDDQNADDRLRCSCPTFDGLQGRSIFCPVAKHREEANKRLRSASELGEGWYGIGDRPAYAAKAARWIEPPEFSNKRRTS